MSAPTPGPWVAKSRATGGYNIVAVDDVLEDVVVGTAVLNDHSLETAHANAQVLAAAPAMAAAIKTCQCPGGGWNGMPKDTDPTVENCMAAGACGCDLGDALKAGGSS